MDDLGYPYFRKPPYINHTSNSSPKFQLSKLLAGEPFVPEASRRGFPSMAILLFEEVGTSRFAAKSRMHQCDALVVMLKDDATI